MTRKKYDLAVKTGSYTDRDGNEKGRYENIGAMMEGDKGPFLMLKRTFNPAGVNTDRDSILVSMFEPKERERQEPARGSHGEIEDEIPF